MQGLELDAERTLVAADPEGDRRGGDDPVWESLRGFPRVAADVSADQTDAGVVQHRNDPGEHAARHRLDGHAARHLPVDLDDVRLQAPDAVEVGTPRAEVVDDDEAAEVAVVVDRGGETLFALQRQLGQLHRHAIRGKTVRLQHLREERFEAAFDRDVRVEVEKEAAARVAQFHEFLDLQAVALAIELGARLALGYAFEELLGRDAQSVRARRPDQRLVGDGPLLLRAEDRLKVARKIESGGCSDALGRAVQAQAPRREIQQLHGRFPSYATNA